MVSKNTPIPKCPYSVLVRTLLSQSVRTHYSSLITHFIIPTPELEISPAGAEVFLEETLG